MSKNWENLVHSGSYKRKVKKYVSIDASILDEQLIYPENTEPAAQMVNDLPDSIPLPCSSSHVQSQELHNNSEIIDDLQTLNEDDSIVLSDGYYSPDEGCDDYADDDDDSDLTSFLQKWSLDFNITHAALKPLLTKLSQYDRMLPEDPRRLLATPRDLIKVCEIEGGKYWHQGLGECRLIFI